MCDAVYTAWVLAQEDTEAGEAAESEMPGSAEEQEGAKTQEDDQVEETSETQENSEGQESAGTEEPSEQAGPQISAPSAILMEASTGQVIYEKNPDEQRPAGQCYQGYDPAFDL